MAEQPMLERIARKLCEIDLRDPNGVVVGEGVATGRTWLGWHAFIADAQSVLTAMREPTSTALATLPASEMAGVADHWRALIDVELENLECKAARLRSQSAS